MSNRVLTELVTRGLGFFAALALACTINGQIRRKAAPSPSPSPSPSPTASAEPTPTPARFA